MTGLLIRNVLFQPKFQVGVSKFLTQRTIQSFGSFGIYRHHSLLAQQCKISIGSQRKSNYFKEIVRVPASTFIQFAANRKYSQQGGEKNSAISINLASASTNDNSTNSKKGSKFKKYAIITVCVVYGGMFLSILYNLGLPFTDDEGHILRDEFSDLPPLEQFFRRMFDRLYVFKEFLRRPSREHLLPDVKPSGQPNYTLVLEVTHVLLHPDWTYQTGWRFKKRPNVDHFLEQLSSPLYEIVVFTSQAGLNMYPIVESLDKGAGGNMIDYSLYRDATEFINGEHVKNLAHLNRDLSKVIVVDWNPNAIHLHPENALILPKWNGNDDDTTLVELVAFLKNVAEKSPDDVRQLLSYYKQFPDPMEHFRESQRKLPQLSARS